jgi:hypothetical protein
MLTAGIDASSRAVDIVLLTEDDHATHHRYELQGGTPFERARYLRHVMPRGVFWDGVALVGLEQTYSGAYSSATALALIRGALAALLPSGLTVLETRPNEWQKIFTGVPKLPKTSHDRKMLVRRRCSDLGIWAPDAKSDFYDAVGIAWAVRELCERAAA